MQPSAGKVMAIVFWDAKGVIMLVFLPKRSTITRVYGRFPISSNTLIIRTPLAVLQSPPKNCSYSSNSHVFFQTDF